MSINEETGLPEVAPKEFWRIRRAVLPGWGYVELRRKLLIGSKLVKKQIFYSDAFDRERLARNAAWEILSDLRWERMDREWAKVDPLFGDYPPKRLGVR